MMHGQKNIKLFQVSLAFECLNMSFTSPYFRDKVFCVDKKKITSVHCVWNVMAHAKKPDIVFRRNGRVHLNRRGRQFSWLLAAELSASAVVMLDTPRSEAVCNVLATHSHSPVSPSLPLQCVTVCHQVSNALYVRIFRFRKIARVISSMISRSKCSNQGLTFKLCSWSVSSTTAKLRRAAKLLKH